MITSLYIHDIIADKEPVQRIEAALGLTGILVSDPSQVYRVVESHPDPIAAGKSILFLTENRGAFVKDCPGTRCYRCCGYKILHIGAFCTMDCAYCILQVYFHPPLLTLFLNFDRMHEELDRVFRGTHVARIGTGEFTDSMIFDRWTGLSPALVQRFAGQDRAILELKTKTADVSHLTGLDHNGRTILAWSMNTERVIRKQERGTSSLSARLKAAAKGQGAGFPVAFHFDPLVLYDGCEPEYEGVVKRIFDTVDPERTAWISLGALRYPPALKTIIQARFPDSVMPYGEFITGMDNKLRYFKPLRMRLFRRMARAIRKVAPEVTVYFCMEDDIVWQNAFGFTPSEKGGLPAMLDRRAMEICGVDGEISPLPEDDE